MKETKSIKRKQEYTALENLIYLIRNMWKWDKYTFMFLLFQIPLSIVSSLIGIYIPKVLIDSIYDNVSITQLLLNIGVPILIMIVTETFISSSKFKLRFAGNKYRMKYVAAQIDKTIVTDYENIDGAKGQEKFMKAFMSTNSNDSGTQAIANTMVEFIANILGFILYTSIIFSLHPLLIGFIIVSSIINYLVGNNANKFEFKNKERLAKVRRKLEYIRTKSGDFKSAKDLRLYNMSPWFTEMYKIYLSKRIKIELQNRSRKYLVNIIDGILVLVRDGMAYGFLIYSVIYKDMEIGNFVLYFGAVAGFSTWLSGIIKNLNSFNTIHLETLDLREYLEMEDKMNKGKGHDLPRDFPFTVELQNLYYKYPGADDYTIKNINLKVEKGEKLALVGINGAGKTTLVKMICGLYTPTKGQILINGIESSKYNRDDYYSMFSVVFQDIYLMPMSIEKNITLQLDEDVNIERLNKTIKIAGLDNKIKSLPEGLDTLLIKTIHDNAIDLSGGEMQKLMLARALYKNAPIIILDEPTAALDPIAENEIYQKYNDLTKNHTSIFISHRLSSTRFCDRIIFVENGEIVEEGNHYELMNQNGKYANMYNMQAHYYKEINRGGNNE